MRPRRFTGNMVAWLCAGFMRPYIDEMAADIAATVRQSVEMLDRAERKPEGWVSPNGSLVHSRRLKVTTAIGRL